MDISSILGSSANSTASTNSAGTTSTVDPSHFMELLMAQMTHQNPMEPMNDSEMMGQMAQLNSLQELQTIKQSMQEMLAANQASYAASLIGKTIHADDGKQSYDGVITSISLEGGKVFAHIGDVAVPIDQVREISTPKQPEKTQSISTPKATEGVVNE